MRQEIDNILFASNSSTIKAIPEIHIRSVSRDGSNARDSITSCEDMAHVKSVDFEEPVVRPGSIKGINTR